MRKLFLLVTIWSIASIAVFAQETKWGVGLNIGYGTDISKPFLGAKVHYDITEAFTVAGSFNHYFKYDLKDELADAGVGGNVDAYIKYWDINADFHWNVLHNDNFKFYPLVGLTYLHAKGTVEANNFSISGDDLADGSFGVNIGVGGQFNFAENWAAGVEAKYQILDGSQFVPMASIMYRF